MAEYYVQDAPDLPLVIRLSLDAVDRIGQEVMSGFGKVPRRGAEVGGLLLGRVVDGERPTVDIDDFVPMPIEYRLGPSWLLSDNDEAAFAELLRHASTGEDRIVGFVRSNTRPEQPLTPEDMGILEKYFPQRPMVVLMIRPFATRPSVASFFARVEGPFDTSMSAGPEFPFRRRALGPAEPGHEQPAAAGGSRSRRPYHDEHPPPLAQVAVLAEAVAADAPPSLQAEAFDDQQVEAPRQRRSGWVWLPLSFIFLLLGALLGFQAALVFRNGGSQPDPFDLRLTVSKSGNNLTVRWDHASAAIRAAQRGTLFIEEGAQERPIELGATELTSGSVVYSPSSSRVEFRLQVFPSDNASITQTVDWGK